jgi:hypothetical protein
MKPPEVGEGLVIPGYNQKNPKREMKEKQGECFVFEKSIFSRSPDTLHFLRISMGEFLFSDFFDIFLDPP